ncbi:MAG: hypothetical protein HY040_16125 [Planctomycetes bacterium]|nr:hypothetical protein [Planctomycetota bacterium]
MKRKRFVVFLLVLVAVAFGIWLEPTRVVWGWLRGEAFYQGRPTSWWKKELSCWKWRLEPRLQIAPDGKCAFYVEVSVLKRDPGLLESWFPAFFRFEGQDGLPAVLSGDVGARGVLIELTKDSDLEIGTIAKHGLQKIREAQGHE